MKNKDNASIAMQVIYDNNSSGVLKKYLITYCSYLKASTISHGYENSIS